MEAYIDKINKFIKGNGIICEHMVFEQSCHTVDEAASAVGAQADDFVKNICMLSDESDLIVGIVLGSDRASTSRVAKLLDIQRPRLANPKEILELTGYPCGGTPSFGYNALFLVDTKIAGKKYVFTGGGSTNSLIKISTKELINSTSGKVIRIRK